MSQSEPALGTPSWDRPRVKTRNRLGCFTILGMIFSGLIVLVVAGFAYLFVATAEPIRRADAFFATIAHEGAAAAYEHAAPMFKVTTSEPVFAAFVQSADLALVDHVSWMSRGMYPAGVVLGGQAHFRNGRRRGVSVFMVKANGIWAVQKLELGPPAAASPPPARPTSTA